MPRGRRGGGSEAQGLPHQGGEQRLLHVQPVLSLVPDARLAPVNHVIRHFFTAVRRQAVQEDRPRVRELHQIGDRKSTRLNSSHGYISYAVFCLKKKKQTDN